MGAGFQIVKIVSFRIPPIPGRLLLTIFLDASAFFGAPLSRGRVFWTTAYPRPKNTGAFARPRRVKKITRLFSPKVARKQYPAPCRIERSLSHTPVDHHSRLVNVPNPIGRCDHALAVAMVRTASSIRRATNSGCSTNCWWSPPRRGSEHVLRQRMFFQRIIFMGVTRIGKLNRQRADFRLVERRQIVASGTS